MDTSKMNKAMRTLLPMGALLVSGCLSYTCSTVKCGNLQLPSSDVRYFVRSFTLSPVAQVYPFGSYQDNRMNGAARAERIRSAFAQHSPELFTDRREGAVPIDVAVDVAQTSSSGADGVTAFLCGFTYGILPGRLSYNLGVTVSVKLSDDFAVDGKWQVAAVDDRAEYNLMFFSPVNLILAPVSEKFNGCRTFGGDTYDWYTTKQMGDLVLSALAHLDQRKIKDALENKPKPKAEMEHRKVVPPVQQPSSPVQAVPQPTKPPAKPMLSEEDIPL